MRVSYEDWVSSWDTSRGSALEEVTQKIEETIDAGYDSIIIEPDPNYAAAQEAGKLNTNTPYTFATEVYVKLADPRLAQPEN